MRVGFAVNLSEKSGDRLEIFLAVCGNLKAVPIFSRRNVL